LFLYDVNLAPFIVSQYLSFLVSSGSIPIAVLPILPLYDGMLWLLPPESLTEAKEAIKDYFLKFPRLKRWLDDNSEAIKQKGFLYSFFGRKRRLLNAKSSDKALQSHDVRSGINFLVQSIASDASTSKGIKSYVKSAFLILCARQ